MLIKAAEERIRNSSAEQLLSCRPARPMIASAFAEDASPMPSPAEGRGRARVIFWREAVF